MVEIDIGKTLEKGVIQTKSRLQRIRERIAEKKAAKRAEKERIRKIAAEERKGLERRFIRRKVRRELAKKFTPMEFRLGEAQRKKRLEKATIKRPSAFGVAPGQKSAGDQILQNLGGFGITGVVDVPPVSKQLRKKKRKKGKKSFTISF